MKIKYIDGLLLKKMMIQAAHSLEANKSTVDALNVFPVPDGDTGTNMSLTINSAIKEIKEITKTTTESITEAMANGSLMGARGNSGVILSQLFRGFAKSCKGKAELSVIDFALALKSASDTAYKAVMRPIEGTILTVAREMSEKAIEISKKEDDFITFMQKIIKYGEQVLNKTPQMLKVLKDAGVVDAGGKGLLFIMKGFYEALTGKEVLVESSFISIIEETQTQEQGTEITFGYCTEFIIRGNSMNIENFKDAIKDLGDSMLVVGEGSLMKVHIHTNHPGTVLEHGLKFGELINIKIDNMRNQHRNKIFNEINEKQDVEEKEFGIITVAMGDGLSRIFKDLNVDTIIAGGQTMNPSTEEIKKAIDTIHAKHIFILPNNSNIILAANQAKELSDKNVTVIPSKTIPQGIAAVLAYNGDVSAEQNIEAMNEAIKKVKTGQVTYSVRDTQINSMTIKKGDILGIMDGNIYTAGKNIEDVAYSLLKNMVAENDEIVTIFYGEESDEIKAQKLADQIRKIYEDIDIEVYYGGQPLYYYIFSVE